MRDPLEQEIFKKLKKEDAPRVEVRRYREHRKNELFYLRAGDVSEYVTQRLVDSRDSYLEMLGVAAFSPLTRQTASSELFYGMVTGVRRQRLARNNVYLVSTVDESNKTPVRVDLSRLSRFSIFPGQVVVVQGKNVSGDEILAERIFCASSLETNLLSRRDVVRYRDAAGPRPIEVSVFAGPYTESGNMEYRGLDRALSQTEADVVILLGPFVDLAHPQISGLACTRTPSEVFAEEVVPRVEAWLGRSQASRAVLVPSARDALGMHVFPDVALCSTGASSKQMVFASNPATFFVNEFLFGVSSFDAVFELSCEEISHNEAGAEGADDEGAALFESDRIRRLCLHVVCQKSFCPVFPCREESPVNYRAHSSLKIPVCPDFLISSSKIKPFSKQVDPCFVINPGPAVRGDKAGTMCRISISPVDDGSITDEMGSAAARRARVEILPVDPL